MLRCHFYGDGFLESTFMFLHIYTFLLNISNFLSYSTASFLAMLLLSIHYKVLYNTSFDPFNIDTWLLRDSKFGKEHRNGVFTWNVDIALRSIYSNMWIQIYFKDVRIRRSQVYATALGFPLRCSPKWGALGISCSLVPPRFSATGEGLRGNTCHERIGSPFYNTKIWRFDKILRRQDLIYLNYILELCYFSHIISSHFKHPSLKSIITSMIRLPYT